MKKFNPTTEQIATIAEKSGSSIEEVKAHIDFINSKTDHSVHIGNNLSNRKLLDQKLNIFVNEFSATAEFDEETKNWTPETLELIEYLTLKWNEFCFNNALNAFGPVFDAETRVILAVKRNDERFRIDIFKEKLAEVKTETIERMNKKLQEGRK